MVDLRETIFVAASQADAFDYIADFANIEDWDPGVVSASKNGNEPASLGTSFELITVFKGTETPMTYTITEMDRPGRIALTGEGKQLTAVDTLTFTPDGDQTRIDYHAALDFRGLARIGVKFLGKALDQLGKDAVAGLKRELDSLKTS